MARANQSNGTFLQTFNTVYSIFQLKSKDFLFLFEIIFVCFFRLLIGQVDEIKCLHTQTHLLKNIIL